MAEVNATPELRFPEFKVEWAEKRTKEIAPLQRGFDLPTPDVIEGIYPVVYSNGVLRHHKEYKVEGPGVITGRSGTIGKVNYIEENFWPHNTSLWVTDFKNNIPRFIYYFYLNFKLERFNAGSTVPTLNRNDVHFVKKRVPPQPEEQQKIASFLTAVDRRIQLLQKKKGKLEEYKKGVMQKLFSQEIRFKDENGNDFPDWEEKRLGEVTKYYDGTHQTPKYVKNGIPFYSVEHVTANQFSKTKFISQQVFEKENERVKLEKGDILMTRIGSIGTAKHIDWDVSASFYVSLALIKQNETFNSKFLSYYISHTSFQKELWKRTIHVAFPKKINLGEIGECLVQLPSLPEQQKIALFLSSLDRKIEQVGLQIEKTQAWKKGLLQKMFV